MTLGCSEDPPWRESIWRQISRIFVPAQRLLHRRNQIFEVANGEESRCPVGLQERLH
jgi:hypothetical protein